MELFGRDAGKSLAEVVARLMPKDREGARTCAVAADFPVIEDMLKEIEVGAHGENCPED